VSSGGVVNIVTEEDDEMKHYITIRSHHHMLAAINYTRKRTPWLNREIIDS